MKHRNSYLLTILLTFLMFSCGSDPVDTTGSIIGTVKDDVTDVFISGATVSLTPSNRTTTTDANGNYQFLGIEQGQYTITVKKSNYKETTATLQVQAGKATEHNFSLQSSASALCVSPLELDFGTNQTQLGLDIINEGRGNMEWRILPGHTWLRVQPYIEGLLQANKRTSVVIKVERTGLAPDDYESNLIVTSMDGGHATVPVRMTVIGQPQVTTTEARFVTAHSATLVATLTVVGDKNGVTEYGHVYSSTNKEPSLEQGDPHTSLHVTGGILRNPSSFTSELTSLLSATTYYVRAYAYNRQGYAYSSPVTFHTEDALQTVLDRNDFGGEEDWNKE